MGAIPIPYPYGFSTEFVLVRIDRSHQVPQKTIAPLMQRYVAQRQREETAAIYCP